MLLPFADDQFRPSPPAMFATAVLCSALYHDDRAAFDAYGAYTGTTRAAFERDIASFPPNFAVLRDGANALVVFDGTTNSAQWIGHCAGTLWPHPDSDVPLSRPGSPLAVGSFLAGLRFIENQVEEAVGTRPHVQITGHSYGAGAGHIYGRHIVNATTPPNFVELLTFGEPKAYDGFTAIHEPTIHLRIINREDAQSSNDQNVNVDPVTMMPPGLVTFNRVGKISKFLQNLFGFSWAHHGDGWLLNQTSLVLGEDTPFLLGNLPNVQTVLLTANLRYAALHLMDQAYLVNAYMAWQRSRLEPGLAVLVPFMDAYLRAPFVPPNRLNPPVAAIDLNEAFFPPGENPVTDAERPLWENVSAFGVFTQTDGGSAMATKMKGSILYGIMKQGFSETFHDVTGGMSYQNMLDALAAVLPFRCKLSNCEFDKMPGLADATNNLLSTVAFRASDDLLNRDVFVKAVQTPGGYNDATGNLLGNTVIKVIWRDLTQAQIAVSYIHGVPDAVVGSPQMAGKTDIDAWRLGPILPTWQTALQRYCTNLATKQLGFATLNLAPANAMGNVTGAVYDAPTGKWTVTMQNAVPQGKFIARLSGFKLQRGLNGRIACQAIGASQFRVLKVVANGTWDGTGTAIPLQGYNNGVPFWNYIVKAPATAEGTILTTKKLGRPFFLQHGRVSRKAA